MLCPLCKSEIDESANFCVKCGKKIPRCPTCNAVLTQRSRFCLYDGTPIPVEVQDLFPEEAEEGSAAAPMPTSDEPDKPRRTPLLIALICLLLVVACAAVFLIWKPFSRDDGSAPQIAGPSEEAGSTVQSTGASTAPTDEDIIPTEEDTVPTTQPTEAPVVTYESVYQVYAADVTWAEARQLCEQMGGTLAAITTQDEYIKVCAQASDSGLTYLWLGARLDSDSDAWSECTWVTGESWNFEKWYPGEPSKQDADGTKENCLCMWKAKFEGNDIGWTFNDQRNDIVGAFPNVSGKIGFVCEYQIQVTG